MTTKPASKKPAPETELRSLISRLDPKIQKLGRSVRAALRKRFPAANELAYDYTSFVVISYSATDRAIDAVLALSIRPDGVRLYLMNGPKLPDPQKLLRGAGTQTRYIEIDAIKRLSNPDVEALIGGALALAGVPLPSKGKGLLIMKTDGQKKRARAKAKK